MLSEVLDKNRVLSRKYIRVTWTSYFNQNNHLISTFLYHIWPNINWINDLEFCLSPSTVFKRLRLNLVQNRYGRKQLLRLIKTPFWIVIFENFFLMISLLSYLIWPWKSANLINYSAGKVKRNYLRNNDLVNLTFTSHFQAGEIFSNGKSSCNV